MGAPHRVDLSEALKAAVLRFGQQKKPFAVPDLCAELKLRGSDRNYVSSRMYQWSKDGLLTEQPRTGVAKVYTVKDEAFGYFTPKPKPAPVPAPVAAPAPAPAPSAPATFDGLLKQWLAQQMLPYGTMLKAAVQEIQAVRKDVDSVLEFLSRPELERGSMPEPTPRPLPQALTQPPPANGAAVVGPVPGYPFAVERRAEPRPVEDSALAVVVSRLGPEWHVNPIACKVFDELDGLTQSRVVKALRTAAGAGDRWSHLGKPFNSGAVPAVYRRPGTWWAFRAGKKDRVVIRRNGPNITLEALVKRNDHRWYSSEK